MPEFAKYRNFPPARIISMDKKGHKLYLLLSWDNRKDLPSKWVRAKECRFHMTASQMKQ
jgi:hypothetical protein